MLMAAAIQSPYYPDYIRKLAFSVPIHLKCDNTGPTEFYKSTTLEIKSILLLSDRVNYEAALN